MKKKEKIRTAVISFCEEKKLTYQSSGDNSIFINDEKSSFVINELRDYILSMIEISKKKLRKLITLLSMKNRIYIVFKSKVLCY